MKRYIIYFGILSILILSSYNNYKLPKGNPTTVRKVVIDAGHGGKDPGCKSSKNTLEKDIALSIALKLGHFIENSFSNVKVIYTRRDDRFIELFERARIANENKADLFISIHCNANPSSAPYGTETYVMGLHKSLANLAVAKKENSSILLEDNYTKKYDGFDPNSPEANIIFTLYQNAYLEQSLNVASRIEKHLQEAGRFDRGVKQAGFLVLYKTTMPGMLVETGFLSNQQEDEFLKSDKGQTKIANAIFKAFKEYKSSLDGTSVSNSNETLNSDKDISDSKDNSSNDTMNKEAIKSAKHEVKNKKKINNSKQSVVKSTISNVKEIDSTAASGISFTIQFLTSATAKDIKSKEFKGLDNIEYFKENNKYKYVTGSFNKLDDAKKELTAIKDKGIKDAFIISFNNGKKISIFEAQKLLNK